MISSHFIEFFFLDIIVLPVTVNNFCAYRNYVIETLAQFAPLPSVAVEFSPIVIPFPSLDIIRVEKILAQICWA